MHEQDLLALPGNFPEFLCEIDGKGNSVANLSKIVHFLQAIQTERSDS